MCDVTTTTIRTFIRRFHRCGLQLLLIVLVILCSPCELIKQGLALVAADYNSEDRASLSVREETFLQSLNDVEGQCIRLSKEARDGNG